VEGSPPCPPELWTLVEVAAESVAVEVALAELSLEVSSLKGERSSIPRISPHATSARVATTRHRRCSIMASSLPGW